MRLNRHILSVVVPMLLIQVGLQGRTRDVRADSGRPLVEADTFKAVFMLSADDAFVSGTRLRLDGVNMNVFIVESEGPEIVGVTESSNRFLARWREIDHSIRPEGALYSENLGHHEAYRALGFKIDNPDQVEKDEEDTWEFDISHLDDEAREWFAAGKSLGPVRLAVVMRHTQVEFDKGLICGPWNVDDLARHHELLDKE